MDSLGLRKLIRETINLVESSDYKKTKGEVERSKTLPSEIKDEIYKLLNSGSDYKNGVVFGLTIHPELSAKIKDKGLPDGFSMGMDKNGYFIYTHRARSHSHKNPATFPIKDIRFIDTTGE